jgi:hypothetical protein
MSAMCWRTSRSIDLGWDTVAAVAAREEVVAFAWVYGSAEVRDLDRFDVAARCCPPPVAAASVVGCWRGPTSEPPSRERHADVPGAVCVRVHENNPGKQALVRAAAYAAHPLAVRNDPHPARPACAPRASVPMCGIS